jgi:hypothetical protein
VSTDDTPRDPLAARLGMAIHQTRHDNDDPDFVMATARKRADRILREFPDLATRPNGGDEALLRHLFARIGSLRTTGTWPTRRKQVLAIITEERAALATPSSAPDAHVEMDGHCRQWFDGYGAAVAASSAPDVEGTTRIVNPGKGYGTSVNRETPPRCRDSRS